MKRLFLLFFVLIPVIASAQIQFGYLSYQQVLKEMPEYAQAMQELQTLKAKYDEEAAKTSRHAIKNTFFIQYTLFDSY